MSFRLTRFVAVFLKEFRHILRDPFTLLFSTCLPFLIVVILGNSIEFNLNEISTVVVDHDRTTESRKLLQAFNSSHYFKTYYAESPDRSFDDLLAEKAKAMVFVPPKFGANFLVNKPCSVQILLDGSDNSSVAAVLGYLNSISSLAYEKIHDKEPPAASPFKIKERFLFNPELNSKWFAIPGLGAVIIAIVAILLTALTICREWEQGSMELLLSTPIESSELILGKITPYAILSSIGFMIVYVCARLMFDVPMVGSHFVLFSSTFLFILVYLGIGLWISVTTKVQQVAVQKALILGLLPTSMLSGFIFPISYMPDVLQWMTLVFPPRWYVDIARTEFLKGGAFEDIALHFGVLLFQAFLIIWMAISKFKRSLD